MISSKLSDKFRNEVSWNGFGSDVMKSGLQKYIRRGNTEKALFCAGELDLFKEALERGETIRTNFLHRLMVIYLEDVANLAIFEEVERKLNEIIAERVLTNRNKTKEEKLISEVVTLMCKSKKARICSHIRAVFNPKYNTHALLSKYPSIKYLWEEIEVNKRKQGVKEEFDYNCELFKKYYKEKNILAVYYGFQIDMADVKLKTKCFGKSKPVWFIFKELLNPFNQKTIEKFMGWYQFHLDGIKERFLCWLFPLLFELGVIPKGEKVVIDDGEKGWDRNRRGDKFVVDDYVEDRHTRKGAGKSLVEFAVNGAYVENEANFVNQIWKQFYEDGKRWEEGEEVIGEVETPQDPVPHEEEVKNEIVVPSVEPLKRRKPKVAPTAQKELKDPLGPPLETEEYSFICRTQLNTSRAKQDVYLAKDKQGKLKVVKGPYEDMKSINILKSNHEWKIKHGLPYIPFEVKEMIPDRWMDGVPLGIRNKVDRTVKAYFLVFDSVIHEEEIKKKLHSSKVWPETEVVDWEKIPLHFNYKARELLEQEMIDYVHNILYRYLCGISDLADRNFLMVSGRVISIDEEVEDTLNGVYYELRKNKSEYIYDWLENNYEKLNVQNWTAKRPESRVHQLKLEEIKNKEYCKGLFGVIIYLPGRVDPPRVS